MLFYNCYVNTTIVNIHGIYLFQYIIPNITLGLILTILMIWWQIYQTWTFYIDEIAFQVILGNFAAILSMGWHNHNKVK